MAALGLHCCTWAFSSCGEWGPLFIAVCGLLIAVTSRCRAWAPGTWASVVVAHELSRPAAHGILPGLEPVSPALAGRFLTTAPPGKSLK